MSCTCPSPVFPWFLTLILADSTKLDAEKRLALQQEKEALDLKLLEV